MIIHTAEQAISKLPHVQLDSSFSPREILHMILAGGPAQKLYNIRTGQHQRAVEFLCTETGLIPEYAIKGGIVEEHNGEVRFQRGTRSFPANQYDNEFLGTLAFSGVHFPSISVITDRGTETTLQEMAETAMGDFRGTSPNLGWSLLLFSLYPGVLRDWINIRGEVWNVERLLEMAIKQPYGAGPSFGTPNLRGIAFAISRYCLEQDLEPKRLEGSWQNAYEYFSGAVRLMKKNQHDEGSLDRCWFRSGALLKTASEWKEKLIDVKDKSLKPARAILSPTGHCLNAVSPLFDLWHDDRDWIDKASYIIAHTIELQWVDVVKDLSALTSAIHALKRLDL